jgi:hypothetical protein
MYILESRDNLSIERMTCYFVLDHNKQLHLFDIEKVIITEGKKPKGQKDENYFIDCLRPEISLIPPTFNDNNTNKRVRNDDSLERI